MRVFETHRDGGLLVEAIRHARSQETPRTGVHVSTICDALVRSMDRKSYAQKISDTSTLGFQETGNAVEDVLAARLRERIPGWHKPRPRADERGVIGSPDGARPRRDNRRLARVIDEVKATWVKESTYLELGPHGEIITESLKFYRHRIQAMHYAYIWGAERIYLHVLFMCGNYRPVFPSFRTFKIVVTPRERRENALLLWQHAEDMGLLPPRKRAAA